MIYWYIHYIFIYSFILFKIYSYSEHYSDKLFIYGALLQTKIYRHRGDMSFYNWKQVKTWLTWLQWKLSICISAKLPPETWLRFQCVKIVLLIPYANLFWVGDVGKHRVCQDKAIYDTLVTGQTTRSLWFTSNRRHMNRQTTPKLSRIISVISYLVRC